MRRDVQLRVEGALLERLLQRALERGARFSRVRRSGPRALTLATDGAGAEILEGLCARYGLGCRVLRRGGLTALRARLRARWTLFPCAALGLLLCLALASRIWLVDVRFTGALPELGDRGEVLQALREAGVETGMAAHRIDASLLQKRLAAACEGYSFIGVRRQGIRLLVELSPESPAPQLYALSRARDLVAARDGVVESVAVRAGRACVQVGDIVRAGQLLIRGEERSSGEEVSPVAALGEVVARCWFEGSASGALAQTEVAYTGEQRTSSRLRLMGWALELTPCEAYDSQEVTAERLPVVGLFLPLELERRTQRETVERTLPADEAALEARLRALALAQARGAAAASGASFERASAWTEVSREDGFMSVRAVYEVYTDIAASRGELIEEGY